LDGENVALDELGRSSFQSLQSIATESVKPPIVYYVFDLLCLKRQGFTKVGHREAQKQG